MCEERVVCVCVCVCECKRVCVCVCEERVHVCVYYAYLACIFKIFICTYL